MGRKRRSAKAEQQGAGAGSTNNKDDSVTTLLPHHVEDLLFSLLDVIGCFGSNEEHLVTTTTTAAAANRQCLVQSLTSLSSKLAVFHQENRETNSQGTHTTDTEKVCRHLRLVEAAVADFRNRAEAFLESMDAERSEVGHLSQCIHSALFHIEQDRQISLVSWHILVRSLVEQYRAHTWVEEETILGLLSTTRTSDSAATATALDELYITESLDEQLDQKISTEHPVHVLLRCLSRHALTQQSQFQDVVCMLKESLLNDKFDKSLVRTPTIQSCSMPAAENTDGVPLPLECDSTYVSSAASADDDDTVWTANSPMCAVEAFLRSSTHPTNSNVTALLVVGSEGSGKTHLCGAMERLIQLSSPLTKILYPKLPLDILQSTLGGAENVLLSFIGAVLSYPGPVVVIIDNVEHATGESSSSSNGSSSSDSQLQRCKSAFLTFFDSLRTHATSTSNILIVVTASTNDVGPMSSRFDRIFYLELPDEQARRSTLINSLRLDKTIKLTDAGERMTNVVEATIGKSYSELVQYCRQAIDVMARSENDQASEVFSWSALAALNDRLQSVAPESVRSGVMDDCVDMRVFTAKDLLGTLGAQASNSTITTPKIGYTFPMKGKSAAAAWKEMQTSVVVPLCQSKKLYALIDAENGGTQQSVVGAILLTGESGSGKSEIAMHCARHSALLLPTVKLIDVSCTSLIHKEVGGSERAVHQLFHAARRAAPCILMLDGIETVAAVRGNDATTEGTMDRVLSTLLIELDGVEDYTGPNRGIAVIGITRDASWIDPALKRPGRLNRAICLQRDWS